MNPLPNLLIVDDTEINLIFLESMIRKLKVNVIRALSGAEALEKIKGIELALAILDVRMPGISGYELAILMNKERTGEKVPIIFITANMVNEQDTFKGYSSGAVDYIYKPINSHMLVSKISIFLDLFNQKQRVKKEAERLRISEEKLSRAHEALKKSEERYRSYVDNAPDGVLK